MSLIERERTDLASVALAPGALELTGAPEGFDALTVADIARARGGPIVFVARDGARAQAFADAFAFFAPELELLSLPAWDCLPWW
jgi:transcription-repair coupling factor (superfamily II helicase)